MAPTDHAGPDSPEGLTDLSLPPASGVAPLAIGLALGLATVPALTGGIGWFTADLAAPVSRAGFDLLPLFQILLCLLALAHWRGSGSPMPARPLPSALTGALVLFGLTAASGLAFSAPDPTHGAVALASRALAIGSGIAVAYLATVGGRRVWTAFALVPVLAMLAYAPVLGWLVSALPPAPEHNWKGGPLGFNHVRIFGMFLAAAIGVAGGLWLSSLGRGRLTAGATLLGMAFLWALLFWSGSRAGVAALAGATVAIVAVAPARHWPLLPGMGLSGSIGAVLSLAMPVPHHTYNILVRAAASSADTIDRLSSGRVTMWREALRLMEDMPVTGIGYDQFRFLSTGRFEGWEQPHNSVLEAFLFFGYLGGAALIVIVTWLWVRSVLRLRDGADPLRAGVVMALTTLLGMSLLDGVLYHEGPLTLVAICIAVALSKPRDPTPVAPPASAAL